MATTLVAARHRAHWHGTLLTRPTSPLRSQRGSPIGARLPDRRRVIIDERKVRDYLLSRLHPVGRFKADLLASAGFLETDWKPLIAQLRRIAVHGITTPGHATPYGRKYVVWGTLRHGDGVALRVLTVWMVTVPGNPPRFVTLIPRR